MGAFLLKHKHACVYFFIAQVLLLLSSQSLIQHIRAHKPMELFPLVHIDAPQDYYTYLAFITEGKTGSWLRYDPFASGPVQRGVFHIFYILIGKFAAIGQLSSYTAYTLVRLVSDELYFVAIYFLSRAVVGNRYALWAGLFSLLGTFAPRPFLYQPIEIGSLGVGYPFWESFDAIERLNAIAHQMFGQAMMLVFIYSTFQFFLSRRFIFCGIGSMCIVVAGIIFPPLLPVLAFSLVGTAGFFFVKRCIAQRTIVLNDKIFIGIVCMAVVVFSIVGFLRLQEKEGRQWDLARTWELDRWDHEPSFPIAMPFLFGILPILALPAAIRAFHKRNMRDILLTLWAYYPFIIYPFSTFLGIPKIRLLHGAPYVGLGLLAAQTIFIISPAGKRNIVRIALCMLFFLTTIPVLIEHLSYRVQSVALFITQANMSHFHIARDAVSVLQFIKREVPKESVIISEYRMGNIIPAFAPVRSYFGHRLNTPNFFQRGELMQKFFGQTMSDAQARQFLQDNDITYVYFGKEERDDIAKGPLRYPFLRQRYAKGNIVLYKVE